MIKFEVNKNIAKPVAERNIQKMAEAGPRVNHSEGKKVIDDMTANYNAAIEFSKKGKKVPRGDDNWYKHSGIVMRKMAAEYPDTKKDDLLRTFLVAHIIESLLFEDKLALMYSLDNIQKESLEWYAKEYFETNSIEADNFRVFIMYKLQKRMIMILNEANTWVEAEPEDQREVAASKTTKDFLAFRPDEYNKIVGFIGYGKNNSYLVFKTKNMDSKRDTGARCDEAGKVKTLQKLNEIVGTQLYTNENTKAQKDEDGNVISEAIGHVELCVLQEFILRYFNTIRKDDKKWMLTPEMAIWHKLYLIHA